MCSSQLTIWIDKTGPALTRLEQIDARMLSSNRERLLLLGICLVNDTKWKNFDFSYKSVDIVPGYLDIDATSS